MFVKPSGQFRYCAGAGGRAIDSARYLKYSLPVYYYYYHVSQVFTRQITTINKEYGPPPVCTDHHHLLHLTNAQHKMHFSWFPGFHILTEKISVKVGYLGSGSSAKNLKQELWKEKLRVNNSLFSIFLSARQSCLCWSSSPGLEP